MRAELLDLDAQIDRSYDRYAFIRNAWLQRREFQVTDGNVDDQSLELEEDMEQDRPKDERAGCRGQRRRPERPRTARHRRTPAPAATAAGQPAPRRRIARMHAGRIR